MSGYNIDFAISADLSADVVKEMITKCVEEQTGRVVDNIVFTTQDVSMPNERLPRMEFVSGCKVYFAKDGYKLHCDGYKLQLGKVLRK